MQRLDEQISLMDKKQKEIQVLERKLNIKTSHLNSVELDSRNEKL